MPIDIEMGGLGQTLFELGKKNGKQQVQLPLGGRVQNALIQWQRVEWDKQGSFDKTKKGPTIGVKVVQEDRFGGW